MTQNINQEAQRRRAFQWSTSLALALLSIFMLYPFSTAHGQSNLIVGGDAEEGACSDDYDVVTTVPGWIVIEGSPKILCYSAGQYTVPSESKRGKAFLSGGPYGNSTLLQSIDISSAYRSIDSGSVKFDFSGWFGGDGADSGSASATLRFVGANGQALGDAVKTIPVTPQTRRNMNRLVERNLSGFIPRGTRNISVALEFTGTTVDRHLDYKHIRAINMGYADNLSLSLSVPVTVPTLAPPASTVPSFDHVFLIMMENTTYSDLMGNLQYAPFIKGLMTEGSQFTKMVGIDHPSDQNYLAIAGGVAFVKGGIYFPNIRVNAKHIGDSLEAIGKTWKGYGQGMGVPCGTTNQYDRYFDADDLPFINFTNIRDDRGRCESHLVDTSELHIDLKSEATTPNFLWIAANDYYDGEAAYNEGGLKRSLQAQDQWLRETIAPILSSPAWKNERSLFIVTWDESYYPFTQNHIPTLVFASQNLVRKGYRDNNSANLYDIARTIEEALGIPPLTSNDKYGRPLNGVFTEHVTSQ